MDRKDRKKADGKPAVRDESQLRDLPRKPLSRVEETNVRGGQAEEEEGGGEQPWRRA